MLLKAFSSQAFEYFQGWRLCALSGLLLLCLTTVVEAFPSVELEYTKKKIVLKTNKPQ